MAEFIFRKPEIVLKAVEAELKSCIKNKKMARAEKLESFIELIKKEIK